MLRSWIPNPFFEVLFAPMLLSHGTQLVRTSKLFSGFSSHNAPVFFFHNRYGYETLFTHRLLSSIEESAWQRCNKNGMTKRRLYWHHWLFNNLPVACYIYYLKEIDEVAAPDGKRMLSCTNRTSHTLSHKKTIEKVLNDLEAAA